MKKPASKTVTKCREFIESFDSLKEAADYIGKKESTIAMWMKTNRFPIDLLDIIDQPEVETEDETLPTVETQTSNSTDEEAEWVNDPQAGPSGENINETEARLADLHFRVQALENAFSQNQPLPPQLRGRSDVQGSSERIGRSYGGIPKANEYAAGARNGGLAPTREQAHWSAQGQRGAVAGPAKPRQRKPGSPGTYNWNSHEPRSTARVMPSRKAPQRNIQTRVMK